LPSRYNFQDYRSLEIILATVVHPQHMRLNLVVMCVFDCSTSWGRTMTIDFESWDAGYVDGQIGRSPHCAANLDRFSYLMGYREGRAYHMEIQPARTAESGSHC
jgi:hypothetical protein